MNALLLVAAAGIARADKLGHPSGAVSSSPGPHAVFLSYASQDVEAARCIGEALRAGGIEVWFDRSELRGGDAWDQSIRRQIRECEQGRLARDDLTIVQASITGDCAPSAKRSLEEAARNPLDASAISNLAWMQQCAGLLEASAQSYRRAIELNAAYDGAKAGYATTLLLMGKADEALAQAQDASDEEQRLFALACSYWALGRKAESDATLHQPEGKFAHAWSVDIADVHAYRGVAAGAVQWLQRAYEDRRPALSLIKIDPLMASLEGDPRFKAVLRKLKLPE